MDNAKFQDDMIFSSVECHLYTTDQPTFPVAEHWHYFAEIVRVRSGSLKVSRENKVFILSSGDAVFINPLKRHSLDFNGSEVTTYEVIRLDMEQFGDLPSYSPDLRGLMLEADRRGLSMLLTARELHEKHLDNMIDMCVQEYRTRAYGYDLRIRSLLYLIFTAVIRRWIADGFIPQVYGSRIDPIYTLPSYIARHIQDPLKVEDLAQFCGLSYPWFARKFHQIYGISCKEYIEKIRIRRVEHYLQFTDCDLNYISQHTGYADCSHLVRDFRKFRNTTPGQFRQAYRQKGQAVPQSSAQFPQSY
ncbi:MAG: AraC family transcriptional regulator [Clostridiales bacterium]|nr:AraC family transcriptional regulator [Clostridiales bacterium]